MTTSNESLAQRHHRQIEQADAERRIQFLVREARQRVRTYAMDEALFHLTGDSMGKATPMERCKRVTAILEAVVKHEKGASVDDISTRAGMRIGEAIEVAAWAAAAEYADWHAFLATPEAARAEAWELENLARSRDLLGPLPAEFYSRTLAAFRTCKRTDGAEARS